MEREDFVKRLTQLRMDKGVSARDMSLSLGQSANYINGIENGEGYPSMGIFFYICEYFGITPKEFFDLDLKSPSLSKELADATKDMPKEKLEHLIEFIKK